MRTFLNPYVNTRYIYKDEYYEILQCRKIGRHFNINTHVLHVLKHVHLLIYFSIFSHRHLRS